MIKDFWNTNHNPITMWSRNTSQKYEDVKDTYAMQKSTYFQELTNKIDTVIRKNFNPEM